MESLDRITLTQDADVRKIDDNFVKVKNAIDAAESNIANKQDKLASGTNIKTINNESLLGSGNINIQGGSGNVDDVEVDGVSVVNSNKVAEIDLTGKQDKLTAGDGINPRYLDRSNIVQLNYPDDTPTQYATNLPYSAGQINTLLNNKQDKLTAGTGITIDSNNVISASGEGGSSLYKYDFYFDYPSGSSGTAGSGITKLFFSIISSKDHTFSPSGSAIDLNSLANILPSSGRYICPISASTTYGSYFTPGVVSVEFIVNNGAITSYINRIELINDGASTKNTVPYGVLSTAKLYLNNKVTL